MPAGPRRSVESATMKEQTTPILEVTTGDYSGRYEVRERRPDGTLVIAPATSIAAMRARRGSRAATPEEIRFSGHRCGWSRTRIWR